MSHPAPLVIAISPYHLVTQEVPALCALLLADQVTTLMPEPAAGTSQTDVAGAMKRSPRFLRFMERIRWSVPLWNESVIAPGDNEQTIADGLSDTYRDITTHPGLGPLGPMILKVAATPPDDFLDHLCGDLIKGGPDPAFCVPVNACLDSFAVRHEHVVARAAPSSVSQRTESLMLRRHFAFVMPMLRQASGHRILHLRRELRPELARLRLALASSIHCSRRSDAARLEPSLACSLDNAAKALAARFEELKAMVAAGDDDEGRRIVDGYVSVTVLTAPSDAVLRSSAHAAKSASRRVPVGASAVQTTGEPDAAAPVASTHLRSTPLTVMVIKLLNARPDF